MKAAPHPLQQQRLATLRKYEILDTPREEAFDEIAELASEVCGTPIAVVNIIDEHRQWFKAEVGLGTRETPLPTSICSHVILEADFVEIHDTLSDPRTADNELCIGEGGLRFYAGALLKAPNGLPLGTLCVLDNKPRTLNDMQKRTIAVLARRVMKELELKRALSDHQILRDEMDHRVKNSLQTLASYVRVYQGQLRKNEDPAVVLDAVARRIEAVAALHEALHNTDGDQTIQLDVYLGRIADYLRVSAPDNVSIALRALPIEVEVPVASAIGVVVSEFVANSIKHAFPGQQVGQVTIDTKTAAGQLLVTCHDDGIGRTETEQVVEQSRSGGLGTRIVNSAASQIGATLSRKSDSEGYWLDLAVPV